MEIAAHIDALEHEGRLLAELAEGCGPDASVPTCPGWKVRDLVKHLGYVHRWATRHVAEASPTLMAGLGEAEVLASGPCDDDLFAWFRDGHAALVETLCAADPDLSCFTFLPSPSALGFWSRRQAHETAVHRADAEAAAGRVSRFDAEFAADGVDELLMGFAPTERSKVRADQRRVLLVQTTDADGRWLVGMGPDGVDTARGSGPHDGALRGGAAALYLTLWNRADPASLGVEVENDDLVKLWSTTLQVRWSS
jgi:uncharacterized protein (TIGR03083 family)